MKKVLICGAGMSATDLIAYMLDHAEENNWEVVVGDICVETAERKIGGHPRGKAVYFDCYDDAIMEQHIRGAAIVISLLPPGMHAAAARIALKHNAHVVTASYTAPEMRAMHEAAKAKGLTFLNELGADPGIDHMNGMRSINTVREKGGEITGFSSYCGSLVAPESNDNPWGYKFTWSPMNVILAGDAGARYYENGHLKSVPYHRVFRNPKTIHIPGFLTFEAYPNRDSIIYRKKYGLENIPTLIRATLRYPGYCSGWQQLIKLGLTANNYRVEGSEHMTYREWVTSYLPDSAGMNAEEKLARTLGIKTGSDLHSQLLWMELLSDRPIKIQNGTPAEILLDLLRDRMKFKEEDNDMLVFYDRVEYKLKNTLREHVSYLVTKGLAMGHTAISRTVGLPAAIGAKRILKGQLNTRGVVYPWAKEVYEPVLKELEEDFGICYTSDDRQLN
jgi:saccharopine dehydrogenase-like NADP-dependent oxidoreductase